MALDKFSKFYYGWSITEKNYFLNFDEGGPELAATLKVGSYNSASFAIEISRALNAAGNLNYTVTFNRVTRLIQISAPSNFTLKVTNGMQVGLSAWSLVGFTSNKTGSNSYLSDGPSGFEYIPQYFLQDYVPTKLLQKQNQAVVNKSTSGIFEVVSFGVEKFMECNIKFITDIIQPPGGPIRSNQNGVSDALDFISYASTKNQIEFMEDYADPLTFQYMILQSTSESADGVAFRLLEEYAIGLPEYYQTAKLVFLEVGS